MQIPNFLEFRNYKYLGVKSQMFLIVALYLFMVFFGYFEYNTFGATQTVEGKHMRFFFVPIYEEIIFRGFILFLALKYLSPVKSIIFSSFLFGIWHLKNILYIDPDYVIGQTIYTMFIVGPIFGYISYKTKTIWITVILHFLNNIGATFFALAGIGLFS